MKIVEKKNLWFALSGVIIIAGLLLGLLRGFNTGIDFSGGTLLEIDLHQTLDVAEIREITDDYDPSASINLLGDSRSIVQIRSGLDLDNDVRQELFNQFQEAYGLENDDLLRTEQFGPAVGREIQRKALIAILVSAACMLVYISFRFELRFGLAAIIALIHDVLFVIAIYAILQIPINSPFVAAVLTIVGYSINDTIILFDRIRENLKHEKKPDYTEIANRSIGQTLSRTINTSVTTLLTITVVYVLGVEQIKEFALPLIAGFIAGTYSSVFIASPIWVMLKKRQREKTA